MYTAPRLICGAVYKHLAEKMKFLWGADLRLNTVHVNDVCKALWHGATRCPVGSVFNLADKGDTSTTPPTSSGCQQTPFFLLAVALTNTSFSLSPAPIAQGTVNDFLEKLFHIKTAFLGSVVSNMAKLNMKNVTEEINDKHLKPWSELCKAHGITNTPLTPYLDQELLYNNSLSVDGSKIESTGYVDNLLLASLVRTPWLTWRHVLWSRAAASPTMCPRSRRPSSGSRLSTSSTRTSSPRSSKLLYFPKKTAEGERTQVVRTEAVVARIETHKRHLSLL
jgi:hypothetical protein